MQTRTIEGTNFRLEYIKLEDNLGNPHVVSIYAGSEFWDWQEFATYEEAQAFMADPFKTERKSNEARERREKEEEAKLSTYYARDYTRVSRGRQVGPHKR